MHASKLGPRRLPAVSRLAPILAPRPCLTRAASRSIVVAVDDTMLSWQAVRWTLGELYREGDVLHLLHVIPADATSLPVPPACLGNSGYSPCVISPEQMEDALAEHAELFITQCLVGLVDACSAKCTIEILRPSRGGCEGASGGAGGGTLPRRLNVGEAICRAADSLGAALVVIPGHRKTSFFERLFKPDDHASYASYVAKNSKRPTLIFQPPDSEVYSSPEGNNNGVGSIKDTTIAIREGYPHGAVVGLLQQ